jgi:phospholipid/cholesterol/gamma-HCH transport system substrate-binding protein
MKNSLETRLGMLFALALVVLVIVMEMVGSFQFFKPGVHVRALFVSAQELNAGDPVKMAGVTVGRVEKIRIVDDKVEVSMKLQKTEGVRTDSKASIKFSGFMGQNFVSLGFGSAAGSAVDNDTVLKTFENPDLGEVMAKLDSVAGGIKNLTDSFSGDQIQNVLGPLRDILEENGPRISAILANAKTITTEVAEGRGSIGRLIKEDTFHDAAMATVTNLNRTATDVQDALAGVKRILVKIEQGEGTIGKLTTDETLYREGTAALTNLREILQKMNQGQGSVGKLINDESFYRNIKLTLQKIDKGTESLEDQGPLTVLGMAIGKLF